MFVLFTEGLSIYKLVNFQGLVFSWSVATTILLVYAMRNRILFSTLQQVIPATYKLITKSWIAVIILFVLLISLAIALLYPPNNYDSMTYHMARVAHWQQQESISHYQTHILRQLIYQPFAEWIILHFQLLTGGDRFANATQLFFFAGCILCASLLAKELGGNSKHQKLAAFFTCLIPMAIIQSNTTQNDIVVAFFILAFIYFTITTLRKISLTLILLSGISLGLAWLTKGTGYLFSILFCGWYIFSLIKNYQLPIYRLIKKAFLFTLIPIIALVINSGHYHRNIFLTGSPLGNADEGTVNEAFAVKPLLLVSLKNVMNHLPAPGRIRRGVATLALALGVDPNDPKYNFTKMDLMMGKFSFDEDYAQNFIHTLLIIITGIYFLFKIASHKFRIDVFKKPGQYYIPFIFSAYTTAVLFCVGLKWQPWSNRLETSLFMIFSIILAIEITNAKKWQQKLCVVAMLGFGVASLFWSSKHPLLPPSKSIFNRSYASFIYSNGMIECKNYIDNTHYKELGIIIGSDSWDYPYYKLLARNNGIKRTLKHVFVNNASTIYLDLFVPDALISIDGSWDKRTINGKTYHKTATFSDGITIYELQ